MLQPLQDLLQVQNNITRRNMDAKGRTLCMGEILSSGSQISELFTPVGNEPGMNSNGPWKGCI